MTKDLKYFMCDAKDEIVHVQAPSIFKDEDGNPIMMEIRVLSQKEITDLQNKYKTREIATDKRGNPIISSDNEVVWKTTKDSAKAMRHTIVEALQYPNLKDKSLMEHYNCVDVTEMPLLVFNKADVYTEMTNKVLKALGIAGFDSDEDEKQDIEAAKNE